MHHVPKDKRAQRSAELIYEALCACLEEKSFNRITVSDLQRSCGVARTTFYRAFDDVSDVLSWKCETCFREALSGFASHDFMNESELAERFFVYWTEHSEILEIIKKVERPDIILAAHMRSAEALQVRFGKLPGVTETQRKYFIAIRSGILMGVLGTWMQNGRKESPRELMEIIRLQISMLDESTLPAFEAKTEI